MFDTPATATATVVPLGLAAEQLASLAPGSELAWLLEVADLALSDDHALVETVAAWHRLAGWVAAGAAHAAAVLAGRASMNPVWPASAGRVAEPGVAGEELAMRLGCSRQQARRMVRDGVAFEGSLAWTGAALARGDIDLVKARILVEALADRPVGLALDVQDAVLPGAPFRTPSQLARDVQRELIARDPESADERHVVAGGARRVCRPKALPDGMAGLWAVLPATGAARLDSTLDSLARGARAAGDPRTLDQLRADLLVDLTAGDVENTAAWVALAPAPPREGESGQSGGRRAESRPGGGRSRGTSRRTEIRVTVALSTLLGLDDAPAELGGHGAITAEAARALARDGTWRRIVTDPLTGRVLDVGRTRYRPPADLATHVRVRDRSCARPGCSAPAESCDLDHTVEFHRHGGTSSAGNLEPLCDRDHAVKTDAGFRLRQAEPGVFEWVTPTGHRYRVTPGLDTPYVMVGPDGEGDDARDATVVETGTDDPSGPDPAGSDDPSGLDPAGSDDPSGLDPAGSDDPIKMAARRLGLEHVLKRESPRPRVDPGGPPPF